MIITGTSAVVLSTAYTRPEVTLLGICGTSLIALTLVLLGIILGAGNERGRQSNGGTGSGNARRHLSHSAHDDEIKTAMRDTAVTVFGICFAASFMIEGHHTDPLASQANNKYWSGGWKEDRFFRNLGQDLTAVTVEIARCLFTFILVSLIFFFFLPLFWPSKDLLKLLINLSLVRAHFKGQTRLRNGISRSACTSRYQFLLRLSCLSANRLLTARSGGTTQ